MIKTVHYLTTILPHTSSLSSTSSFVSWYTFIEDRYRAVRKEWTIQRIDYNDTESKKSMESILLFYINTLSTVLCCTELDTHLHLTQLQNNVMATLTPSQENTMHTIYGNIHCLFFLQHTWEIAQPIPNTIAWSIYLSYHTHQFKQLFTTVWNLSPLEQKIMILHLPQIWDTCIRSYVKAYPSDSFSIEYWKNNILFLNKREVNKTSIQIAELYGLWHKETNTVQFTRKVVLPSYETLKEPLVQVAANLVKSSMSLVDYKEYRYVVAN